MLDSSINNLIGAQLRLCINGLGCLYHVLVDVTGLFQLRLLWSVPQVFTTVDKPFAIPAIPAHATVRAERSVISIVSYDAIAL